MNENKFKNPNRKLLVNKWKTPDGTILESRSTHDFVDHLDTVEHTWMFVDGGIGSGYIRTSGNLECLCVYNDDPHALIREEFTWKSYGINGEIKKGKFSKLKDLDTDHINAIINTQWHLPEFILGVFKNELEYRQTGKDLIKFIRG